jgi:chromosome segregation ATPase
MPMRDLPEKECEMSEHVEKLKVTVAELEEELRSLETLDDETCEVLEEALREIQTALNPDEPAELEAESLMDRLNDATLEFEGSHPTLTGIISRLIDGLGQMGI